MIRLLMCCLALRKHDVCLLIAIQPKMSLDEKFNTAQNFASQVRNNLITELSSRNNPEIY